MPNNKNKNQQNPRPAAQPQARATQRQRRRGNRGNRNAIFAPVAVGRAGINPGSRPIVSTGIDFIQTTAISSSTQTGSILSQVDLSPRSWGDTHAKGLASLYDKWRIRNLKIDVVTRVPTNVSGGYLAAIDPDPERILTAYAQYAIRALPGSVSAPYWMSKSAICKPGPWLWTQVRDDDRWSSAGTFYLVCDQPPANLTGSVYLNIELRYTLEFSDPSMPNAPSAQVLILPNRENKIADDGKAILCTDPGWNSAFDQSHYNSVYQLHPSITGKFTLGGSGHVVATHARSAMLTGDLKAFIFYQSQVDAVAAGPNPNRSATSLVAGTAGGQVSLGQQVAAVSV